MVYTEGFCGASAGVSVSGPHRTDVTTTAEGIEIRPIDLHTRLKLPRGSACTSAVRLLRHEARLPTDAPGTLTLRFIGQDWPSREEVVIVREVEVEPAGEPIDG